MIHDVMTELIQLRRRLLSAALTQGQMAELRSKIASKIDWGNKYVGFFFVSIHFDELYFSSDIFWSWEGHTACKI